MLGLSRIFYFSSDEADFVLSGAEGEPTVVPGISPNTLEKDLTEMLHRLNEGGDERVAVLQKAAARQGSGSTV